MIRYKTMEMPRYSDKWVTKWHKTHGKFSGWETGGVFGFKYAVIELRRSTLYIPAHDLHPEDRAALETA